MKNSIDILKKKNLKIELSYDPAFPLWVYIWRKGKTLIFEDPRTLMFIVALFTVAKI